MPFSMNLRRSAVFVFNGDSENCTAIDAETMEIVGTLALGGGPEAPVADRKGDIFVNIETTNEVVRFDAASLKDNLTLANRSGTNADRDFDGS